MKKIALLAMSAIRFTRMFAINLLLKDILLQSVNGPCIKNEKNTALLRLAELKFQTVNG